MSATNLIKEKRKNHAQQSVLQANISSDLKPFKGRSALEGMPSLQATKPRASAAEREGNSFTVVPVGRGSQLGHSSLEQSSQTGWSTASKAPAAAATAATSAAESAAAATAATGSGSFRLCRGRKDSLYPRLEALPAHLTRPAPRTQ